MNKILIVDDDTKFAEVMGNFLKDKGYEIFYATDGKEAQDKIFEFLPNIIILEAVLPSLNVIEILKLIKSDYRTKQTPVLILTKHKVPDIRMESAKLGVTIYFEKENTSMDFLLNWIQELINIEKAPPVNSQISAHNILLVEDDPLMVNLYERALKLIGLQVDIAKDGSEALARVKEVKPSVILLDIMMPGMDGFEVLRHLKADAATYGIPVVILTNLEGQKDVEMAMSLGAIKYIVKSEQEPGEVVRIVQEVLSKSASAQSQRNSIAQ